MKIDLWTAVIATTFTCVAGYVDSIGYLDLGQIYVANMSGNSVAVGIHAGWLDWSQVLRHGWPIFSFICGLLLSRLILAWGQSGKPLALALTLETLGLLGFLRIHAGPLGVFLCASAMGVQAAAVSKFNGVTTYTCFVTGSVVKMSEYLADMFWAFGVSLRHSPRRLSTGVRAAMRSPHAPEFVWFAANWIAYVFGAIAGTAALGRFGVPAIAAALVVIATFVIAGLRSPDLFNRLR